MTQDDAKDCASEWLVLVERRVCIGLPVHDEEWESAWIPHVITRSDKIVTDKYGRIVQSTVLVHPYVMSDYRVNKAVPFDDSFRRH